MNFLTPLYLLGALAIVAPIVFHLIRQTPKGEVPFSSIMFLEPSPPKVTQRSRIDHWLLLLLRAGVLALLALAFARPFWRSVAQIDLGDAAHRRVLVLVDTSASMRRGDLWAEAKKRAEAALTAARPGDPLALFAFDTTPHAVMTFAESAALDPPTRLALARARLAALEPTWKGTELGTALAEAVAVIADGAAGDAKAGRVPRLIVLVSDLQAGSRLEALGNLAWPKDVDLALETVAIPGGNAGIEILTSTSETTAAAPPPALPSVNTGPVARARVSNDPGAKLEALQVGWLNPRSDRVESPVAVHVPPGESRVISIPLPPVDPRGEPNLQAPTTLRLTGDLFGFDNSAFVVATPQTNAVVEFLGGDQPDDPNGLLYYLNRVFESTPRRTVAVVVNPAASDPKSAPNLIVVASELAADRATTIRQQVEAGSSALVVVTRSGSAPTLAALLGVPVIEWAEAPAGRDAMLGEIAFDHPTFLPLAGPQFNDFTKIRFWKHRQLQDSATALNGAQVLAKFEDGSPALVEKPVGKGRVLVLASGWNPGDSQLARSSKFVPLMASLLDRRGAGVSEPKRYQVGDRVLLADLGIDPTTATVEVQPPNGSAAALEPGTATFLATDTPGIYAIRRLGSETGSVPTFAVNLDPSESRTGPLPREALEQRGVRLAGDSARAPLDAETMRQMQTAELEGRQKLWRWIVLGAIGLLIGETWLAGRVDHARIPRPAGPLGVPGS